MTHCVELNLVELNLVVSGSSLRHTFNKRQCMLNERQCRLDRPGIISRLRCGTYLDIDAYLARLPLVIYYVVIDRPLPTPS